MIGVVADYLKSGRHRRGRHVLFLGSGAKLPPQEMALPAYLQELAAAAVEDSFERLPAERRPVAQLEEYARQVPDEGERCRALRALLKDLRPAEGHVRLAGLIKDGYFPAIFTMEPHSLLEQALRNHFMEPGSDYNVVVLGVDEPEALGTALHHSSRVTVVKCGGDLERHSLPVTEAEMALHLRPYEKLIGDAFRVVSIFVAYHDRDRPFLETLPREGGKVFWVNPTIPLSDQSAFHELRTDEPELAEYHRLQLEVTSLLEARHSQRHILAREAGSFNGFFSALSTQLKQHSRRRGLGRRSELSVLRGGPYRFLDYFDVEDADFFFGREADTEALLNLVTEHQLSVLFGRSAIGKTSLLRAGLMAVLRRKDEEFQEGEGERPLLPVLANAGEEPELHMRRALLARADTEGFSLPPEVGEQHWPELAGALAEATGRRLLLIIDQFAALFVKVGAPIREHFLEELQRALANPRLHVLISIREDFLGELLDLRDQFPGLMDHFHRLHRLTWEQAEAAITKPAVNFNLTIERDLVQRLLEDLSRQGIEPAQLQIVLYRLYEELQPPSRALTQRMYDQLGGAMKILSTYLDKAMLQLPVNERPLARAILKQMVSSSELRGRWPLDRVVQAVPPERQTVEKVIAHLVDHRLLRVVENGDSRSYELIHEYLAEDLKNWLGEEKSQTRDVQDLLTREFSSYERYGLLLSVDVMRTLTDYARDLTLSPEELELILRSSAASGVSVEYWFGRLAELGSRRDAALLAFLEDEHPEVRLAAAQHLPTDVPAAYLRVLIAALEDEVPEVRENAAKALRRSERQVLALLRSTDPADRRLGAAALSRLGLRRYAARIVEALTDDDPGFAEIAAETLHALGERRFLPMMLRRAIGGGVPWSYAEVLGRLSASESALRLLRRSAAQHPGEPLLAYALAHAEMQARNYEAAADALELAREHAPDEAGRALLDRELERVRALGERAVSSSSQWPCFGRNARHEAAAESPLAPPLRQVWTLRTEGPVVASPVVGEGTVFVGSRDGIFYAMDSARGELRWTFRTGGRIEGTAALAEGLVYFGSTDKRVYALDAARGKERWHQTLGGPVRAACTLVDDLLIVGDVSGAVTALHLDTGRVKWRFSTEGEVLSAPACDGRRVFFGSWDAHLYALDLDTGEQVWRTPTDGPIAAPPSVGEYLVWCGSEDGDLYALDVNDGEIGWLSDLGGRIRGFPALTGDTLILGSGNGLVHALNPHSGAQLWTTGTGDEVLASAAIAGPVAYLGSKDGSLYAFDVESGEVLWKHSTVYGIYSSPALAEEALFLGVSYYYVAAFRSLD